ncbi:MAG: aminotransferase class V-fold PLP-dependent enzyme [Alphaproteobacteria bacterium]|nr:aminotransferase class V-fold PLP-dependent enzyme [Alphaproteobacteria bacterium]
MLRKAGFHFTFEKGVTYLDHGGFGVTPAPVSKAQQKHRRRIEQNPKAFFTYDYPDIWHEVLAATAARFRVEKDNLTFVQNASDGINAVLQILDLGEKDEILTTNLTYGGIDIAAEATARKAGASIVRAQLPFPATSRAKAADYAGALEKSIGKRTKLVIIDHITSATGMVLPVREMVAACRKKNVPVLVDAAHVPGQVAFDIADINPDWYVANLHKWYFVPRSCGIMWTADKHFEKMRPTVMSWNTNDPSYALRFGWTGTRDVTGIMSVPDAFRFMDGYGEENVIRHNHELLTQAIGILSDAWKVKAQTPPAMYGSMTTLPLPAGLTKHFAADLAGCLKIQKILIREKKITASVPLAHKGRHYIRIAAQIYNSAADYKKLAKAVLSLAG